MTFVEWFWRLVSNFGLILRRGHSQGKLPILSAYLRIELKRYFLTQLLKREINSESIFGCRIHFLAMKPLLRSLRKCSYRTATSSQQFQKNP